MAAPTLEAIQRDALALAVARALAVANEAATARGIDPGACLVTVEEEVGPPARVWRVHYGPRDFVHRRGGDLTVWVDERASAVQRIVRGQ